MTHVVFSLHFHTFLLVLFCAALLAAKASEWSGLGGLDTPRVDTALSIAQLAACAAYLWFAIAPVYRASGAWRLIQALLLAVAVGAIVLGYRFVLLLITLHAT